MRLISSYVSAVSSPLQTTEKRPKATGCLDPCHALGDDKGMTWYRVHLQPSMQARRGIKKMHITTPMYLEHAWLNGRRRSPLSDAPDLRAPVRSSAMHTTAIVEHVQS